MVVFFSRVRWYVDGRVKLVGVKVMLVGNLVSLLVSFGVFCLINKMFCGCWVILIIKLLKV